VLRKGVLSTTILLVFCVIVLKLHENSVLGCLFAVLAANIKFCLEWCANFLPEEARFGALVSAIGVYSRWTFCIILSHLALSMQTSPDSI